MAIKMGKTVTGPIVTDVSRASKAAPKILFGVGAVLVLAMLLGGAFLVLGDANRYRAAIEEAVWEGSGYRLSIDGELDFSLVPLGVRLGDVGLYSPERGGGSLSRGQSGAPGDARPGGARPGSTQELGRAGEVALRVAIVPLLQGQVLLREFRAEGVHVNYHVDELGNSLWVAPAPAAEIETVPVAGVNDGADSGGAAAPQGSVASGGGDSDSGGGDGNGGDVNDSPEEGFVAEVQRVIISDAVVDYRNLQSGEAHRISDLVFEGTDLRFDGSPFPVDSSFTYLQGNEQGNERGSAEEVTGGDPLTRNGEATTEPLAMDLAADVSLDFERGRVGFDDIRLSLEPVLLQGNIAVSGMGDSSGLRYEGRLSSNRFEPMALLESLGLQQQEPDTEPSQKSDIEPLQLLFDFSGDERRVQLPSFTVSIGEVEETTVTGDADIRFATESLPLNLRYSLRGDSFDLNALLPSRAEAEVQEDADTVGVGTDASTGAETTANIDADAGIDGAVAATQAATQTVTHLATEPETQPATETATQPAVQTDSPGPLAVLNNLNINGDISFGVLQVDEVELRDVHLITSLEGGVLNIESRPAGAFDGSLQGGLRLDASQPQAQMEVAVAAAGLDLSRTIAAFLPVTSIFGSLDVDAAYNASGSSMDELLASLNGITDFSVAGNLIDISLIKQIFTTISALSPAGDAIQQWPDQIRFNEVGGGLRLEQGIASRQVLQLRMDNFLISGDGAVDIAARRFDYDILLSVLGAPYTQTVPINPRYRDVQWPVRCNAGFDDPVSRFCQPDLSLVREIFADLLLEAGRNELQQRLEEEIDDEVPDGLRERARDLLRNILD